MNPLWALAHLIVLEIRFFGAGLVIFVASIFVWLFVTIGCKDTANSRNDKAFLQENAVCILLSRCYQRSLVTMSSAQRWSLGKGWPPQAFTCVQGSAGQAQKSWVAGRPRGMSESEVM